MHTCTARYRRPLPIRQVVQRIIPSAVQERLRGGGEDAAQADTSDMPFSQSLTQLTNRRPVVRNFQTRYRSVLAVDDRAAIGRVVVISKICYTVILNIRCGLRIDRPGECNCNSL